MTDSTHKRGLTILEILVVVGIIAILTAVVLTVTLRVENQSKERLLGETFAVLESALGQFYEYEFQYPTQYAQFRFPLDCSGFGLLALQTALGEATGAVVQITNHNEQTETDPAKKNTYMQYSGCEVMYFFLSRVPESRKTLGGIASSLVTNKNMYDQEIQIVVGARPAEPLLRVVDPWGTTLKYDYYDELETDATRQSSTKRSFPILVSAGPDKQFGTPDDISSKDR